MGANGMSLPFGGAGTPLSDFAKQNGVTEPSAFEAPNEAAKEKGMRARAKTVVRDLPLVTVQNTWTVAQARGALYAHMTGLFESSSQLWDAILGDDRVMATLGSRISGLFGRAVKFKPADDSEEAKACCDAWKAWWPRLTGDASMTEVHTYGIGMGFSPAQILWDTSGEVWGPYLRAWHPRYTYFHWPSRRFQAISDGGIAPIIPGNGKWVLHAPYGEYRGWIRGAIRAVTEPWMLRHFGFRDMARFSEVHGQPTRVGMVPSVSDPDERAAFEASLENIGADASMILPKGVDGQNGDGYDYKLVEAKDRAWESFGAMIEKCDTSIVLALMFQNLTTEVTGGSFAATSAHMDIRQSGLQFDNASWRNTLQQIARPFAYLNFGNADLAPCTEWDVEPRDDLKGNADQFQKFAAALQALTTGGVRFRDADEVRAFADGCFGLRNLPAFDIEPPQPKAAPPAPGDGNASE